MDSTQTDLSAREEDLPTRLWITIGCCFVSCVSCCWMLLAYRFSKHRRCHANDLYVYGLGLFRAFQDIQRLAFGVVLLHTGRSTSFSGRLCVVNASLEQFFDVGSSLFTLAFFASVCALRGRLDCCGPYRRRHSIAAAPLEISEHVSLRQAIVDASTPSSQTALDEARSHGVDDLRRSSLAWPLAVIALSLVSTWLMLFAVVEDPNASPFSPPLASHRNFRVSLAWCWVPASDDMTWVRTVSNYFWCGVTAAGSMATLLWLMRFEGESSWRNHASIYVRLVAVCSFYVVANTVGVGQHFTAGVVEARAASAILSLFGFWISIVFLATEGLHSDGQCWVGNGFSQSLNHLLVSEVHGVALPPNNSPDPTFSRFLAQESRSGAANRERVSPFISFGSKGGYAAVSGRSHVNHLGSSRTVMWASASSGSANQDHPFTSAEIVHSDES